MMIIIISGIANSYEPTPIYLQLINSELNSKIGAFDPTADGSENIDAEVISKPLNGKYFIMPWLTERVTKSAYSDLIISIKDLLIFLILCANLLNPITFSNCHLICLSSKFFALCKICWMCDNSKLH